MKQYIDKSALVTEIEKRKKEAESNCGGYKSYDEHRCNACIVGFYEEFLEIIDTLEVKEVDLEKEVTNRIRLLNGVHTLDDGKQWWKGTYNELTYFAKYFYELGLKTQHSNIGFPNIDDTLKEEGLDPYSKKAKIFKEAYFAAIDKDFEKFKKGEINDGQIYTR